MVVKLVLAAGNGSDAEDTTVATSFEINMADPRWPTWLVDVITTQAREGARRLRDELYAQEAIPGDGFVPLAAVVPVAERGR